MNKEKQKFFVDAMLGNIARKLRLLGYDTKYYSDIEDKKLLVDAYNEKRIIISKDKDLINKAEKKKIDFIFLSKKTELEQFAEIINKIRITSLQSSGESARCPKCNSETKSIQKNNYKEIIPESVFLNNKDFWQCKNCKKIYWEGSHIKNINKFLKKLVS